MDKILKSKYKITDKICESDWSSTYKGRLMSENREIIVKIFNRSMLDSVLLKNLNNRISQLCKLDHSNISTIVDGDYGWHGFFFVRPYCDGKNLYEYFKENKDISSEQIIQILIQVGEAVEYAHSKNIVHGALNPENVIITDDKRVKVTDFGLEDAIRATLHARADMIFRDCRFISPEEIHGVFYGKSSDIYKMGLLLYYLLTGELPFTAPDKGLGFALKVINGSVSIPESKKGSIPRFLEQITLKALEKDPIIRFSSAAEFVDSLKKRAVYVPKELEIDTSKIEVENKFDKIPPPAKMPRIKKPENNIFGSRIALSVLLAIIAGIVYAFIQVFIGR